MFTLETCDCGTRAESMETVLTMVLALTKAAMSSKIPRIQQQQVIDACITLRATVAFKCLDIRQMGCLYNNVRKMSF